MRSILDYARQVHRRRILLAPVSGSLLTEAGESLLTEDGAYLVWE